MQVYFDAQGSLTATPWANLDVEDTTSFGSEVVTVRKLMVGTYRYYINSYSGKFGPGVTESPTRVELNVGGLSTTFVPPPTDGANL